MSFQIARRPAALQLQLARSAISSSRTFSASASRGEDKPSSSSQSKAPDREARRRYVTELLQNSRSRETPDQARSGPPRTQQRDFSSPRNNHSGEQRYGPPRPFRGNAGHADGGNRSPSDVSAKVLQFKQRLQQGNRGGDRRFGGRPGGPPGRKPFGKNKKKPGQPRRRRMGEEAEKETAIEESLQAYLREQQEQNRQVPIRFSPTPFNEAQLKETWPALPTTGNTAAVSNMVSWLSANYIGSFHPPDELAKRVLDGKRVGFTSEAEKEEVLEMAKGIAAERAEKAAKREKKDDTAIAEAAAAAKAKPIVFEAVGEKEKKHMINTLIRGEYQIGASAGQTGVLASVARSLSTNSTYTASDTAKLLAKLEKGLPTMKQAGR